MEIPKKAKPVKHNLQDMERYYNHFRPTQVWAMRYKQKGNPHIINVKSFEEFYAAIARYNNPENQCCVYCAINPYTGRRNNDNITTVHTIFMDIDTSNEEEYQEIIQYCSSVGLKWDFKVDSGRGKYLFVPITPLQVNDTTRPEIINTIAAIIDHFNSKFKALDGRCKDISRISRVWGSIHYKNVVEHNGEPLQCKLLDKQTVTDEEKQHNLEVVQELTKDKKQKYTMFNDNTVAECYACDSILQNPLTREKDTDDGNTGFNNTMGKNLAIYCFRKFGKVGLKLVQKCYNARQKNPAEANGWFKKAEADPEFKLNCYEIRNYLQQFYPQVFNTQCKRCIREKKNRIIYTDENLNIRELKRKYKSKFKFFITNKDKFEGIINPSEQGESKRIFSVGTIWTRERPRRNRNEPDVEVLTIDDMNNTDFEMFYIGEKEPDGRTRRNMIRQEKAGFYRYLFKEKNMEYVIFSERKLNYGEAYIEGTVIELTSKNLIAENCYIRGTTPLIFLYDYKSKQIIIRNTEELFNLINFTKQQFIDNIYNKLASNGKQYIFRQPKYINILLLSWLLSGKEDYPLHLKIVGAPHCGKSELLERLAELTNEDIIDCGGSTIKALIPSFHKNAPEMGALLRSQNLCLLDELINMIVRTGKTNSETSEVFTTANNILEHKDKHRFGSGKGDIKMSMRARVASASNPATGKTIKETLEIMPPAFVDRFLLVRFTTDYGLYVSSNKYRYTPEQVDFKQIDRLKIKSIIEYLQSFVSEYDEPKLKTIFDKHRPNVPEYLIDKYNSRTTSHHLPLILDGIIKTRCLFEKDPHFTATEQDYKDFDEWLGLWCMWWHNNKMPTGAKLLDVLTEEHKAIIKLVGAGISRVTLKKKLEERNIEIKYNLKFLYDNNILATDGNNKIYPVKHETQKMDMEDIDNVLYQHKTVVI